ncbi:peptidyl-tRNA hydrolase, partial [Vararia minispora EC-137]
LHPRFLLAGLGNLPYPDTRHSLGHTLIDGLANRWRIRLGKKPNGWSGQSIVRLKGGHQVSMVLYKSNALMNISGPSIAAAAKMADHLFVLHDSIDNKVGKVSVQYAAPHRGHNGIKSIQQAYTPPFWTVRLGIGRPVQGEDLAEFVLSKLSAREMDHW